MLANQTFLNKHMRGYMNKVNIDWEMFKFLGRAIEAKLDEEELPNLIVGLSRGGLPLATMLSNRLGVPMLPLVWSLRDNPMRDVDGLRDILDKHKEGEILLVDDLIDSGNSYKDIWETFYAHWEMTNVKITPVVLLHNTDAFEKLPGWNKPVSAVKFSRTMTPEWFVFPWE